MQQRTLFKRMVTLGLLAGLLGFFVYAFLPQPVPVDLAELERGELRLTVRDQGYTRVRDIFVVAAPVSGRLLRIEKLPGDPVVEGQTLLAELLPSDSAILDSRSRQQAQAALRSAEAALSLSLAQYRRAQAELKYAQDELRRAREMARSNTLSRADLERAELNLTTARAVLDSADATRQIREAEREKARALLEAPGTAQTGQKPEVLRLLAPISGQVLRRLQESENVVQAGTPLLELGDPAQMEIVVDLLSRDAVQIETGAPVLISAWGGADLQGRVRRVEPSGFTKISALGIEEQRVNAIIDIIDPRARWSKLGHAYRVDVAITLWQGQEVLQAPTGALFRHDGQWAVFRLAGERARLTPVRIGHSNGQQAEILQGLSDGDQVILHPSERITDDVAVRRRAL